MRDAANARHNCLYRYKIDWGDGTEVEGHENGIGPFQIQKQYTAKSASYLVTVEFCGDQVGGSSCDKLSESISVPANSSIKAL